ncbi:hypothetical protein IM793_07485 [Pedobacter sp. MR2016-19]|uniref:Bacteriocin-like protein n=2 Tax=Pedobacter alluvionis TaxID=475253 RepID=A0ABY2HXD1_9SPHI|nr:MULTISPECIES: hypothetical protein [Pedobacter]MBE5318992.1 hypothetical protein [Pedobacter sp. MR2016-19]QXU40490.1 hypothetical protein KYH19_15950 [Pedobacter sp. D749]TFB33749.1 hypothetical protein E3V97_06800 [Pedobacter alluvionis]
MKKLNLENLNVQEMSFSEISLVEGGSWIGRAWNSIKEFVLDVVHEIVTDVVGADPTSNL